MKRDYPVSFANKKELRLLLNTVNKVLTPENKQSHDENLDFELDSFELWDNLKPVLKAQINNDIVEISETQFLELSFVVIEAYSWLTAHEVMPFLTTDLGQDEAGGYACLEFFVDMFTMMMFQVFKIDTPEAHIRELKEHYGLLPAANHPLN